MNQVNICFTFSLMFDVHPMSIATSIIDHYILHCFLPQIGKTCNQSFLSVYFLCSDRKNRDHRKISWPCHHLVSMTYYMVITRIYREQDLLCHGKHMTMI